MKILQIGNENLGLQAQLSADTEWKYCELTKITELIAFYADNEDEKFDFAAVFFTSYLSEEQLAPLKKYLSAYRVFVVEGLKIPELEQKYCSWHFKLADLAQTVKDVEKNFFKRQYGENIAVEQISLNQSFTGEKTYLGRHKLKLVGNFGKEFTPLVFWRRNLDINAENDLEFWPVYQKSANVDVKLVIKVITGAGELKQYEFDEHALQRPVIIKSEQKGYVSLSLWAKGKGDLELGNINWRLSRNQYGTLILGGQRYADAERDELFYYFEPGDLTPPLNVYFAGYQQRTGFEGYFMMKRMGKPFILFADPRLEGGSFYLGSQQYEQQIQFILKTTLEKLGFKPEDLILSGLSMGTTGALYYGSKVGPTAVIVGKPLVNLGTIAQNNMLHRANEFDTSLDLLLKLRKEVSSEQAKALNAQMLATLKDSKLAQSQLALAYMREDDYDDQAFHDLVEVLPSDEGKIIGHGYTGRHNDESSKIVRWYLQQYEASLQQFEDDEDERI